MKNKIFLLIGWLIKTLTFFWPDVPFLMRLRGFLYSFLMKGCGSNFQVSSSANLLGLQNITVGESVYIASNVTILARELITIGDETMIGVSSVIVSSNHTKLNGSYRFGSPKLKPITIGRGVWVASNATVTAGTKIEDGVLIGACTVASGHLKKDLIYCSQKPTPLGVKL